MKKYFIILIVLCFGIPQYSRNYQRIISLVPSVTQELYLLQMEKNLLACTSYCVVPPAAKDKEKIGDVLNLNLEKILLLKPDLILAADYVPAKYLNAFREFKIKVELFKTPSSFKEIIEGFKRLGKILNKESESELILKQITERARHLKLKSHNVFKPEVCLLIGTKPLYWATGESSVTDYIEIGGGINLLKKYDKGLISREEILILNPDVLILVNNGGSSQLELKKWREFKTIKAVRNNKIFLVDPNLFCLPSVKSFIKSAETLFSLLNNDKK